MKAIGIRPFRRVKRGPRQRKPTAWPRMAAHLISGALLCGMVMAVLGRGLGYPLFDPLDALLRWFVVTATVAGAVLGLILANSRD